MNNPFNIRFACANAWLGEINPINGFCSFEDVRFCFRAYWLLMALYVKKYKCRNIKSIINRYAPSIENNTKTYIAYCSSRVFPDSLLDCSSQLLKMHDYYTLSLAMFRFESGKEPTSYEKEKLLESFNKYFVPKYKRYE